MVQKKLEVISKLGIQSQSSNREKMALKPGVHQDPDCRNKCRVEIKKKMMKSRSFKSTDFESLRSPTRRDQSRFKKLTNASATQKKASPNYMKPTSSSDARRESLQLQVSLNSQTPSKSRSPRSSNRSKASSVSAPKPMKVLVRKSSFKPVRPSMKKSQLDARKATCSSTLKDSKFPPYVELEPGGTESEGFSVMKVCPYTYCSLNGHHHAPSPPLKRFLAAKRQFLKTQKSMRLKGLSSPRKRYSGDGIKEIDTGQMAFDGAPVVLESDSAGSVISSLIDEVYNDFFVEIFAKPVKYDDSSRICDGDDDPELDFAETPEVHLKEESSNGDGGEIPPPGSSESTEAKIEEDDGDSGRQFNELNEENRGQNSDLPTAEDDEFDQEEVQDMDNLDNSIQDQEEISSECCIENYTSRETEIWGWMDEDESDSDDAMDLDWEKEENYNDGIDHSMFSVDGSVSLTAPIPGNEDPQEVECDSDDCDSSIEEKSEETFILQGYEDSESVTTMFGDGAYECNSIKLYDVNENLEINPVSDASESEESPVLEAEGTDSHTQIGIIYSTNFDNVPAHQTESINPEQDNDLLHEHSSFNDDNKEDLYATKQRTLESLTETDQGSFSEEHSSGHQLPETYSESPELSDGMLQGETCETVKQVLPNSDVGDAGETKEGDDSCGKCNDGIGQQNKCGQEEVVDNLNGIAPDQSTPATHCTFDYQPDVQNLDKDQDSEKDQDNLGCHYTSKSTCSEECSDTQGYGSSSPEDCTLTDDKMQLEDEPMMGTEEPFVAAVPVKIPEENEATNAVTNSNRPLPETCDLKGKHRKVGKRPIENCEQLKEFNPRAPRFLDLEPDPEAEKVDLRHQMMDDRKNAEEWMIDYALQRAVNKLAPARKRRVALLVEAFETVAPLPKCEAHLRHSAPSFTHARPIQACS